MKFLKIKISQNNSYVGLTNNSNNNIPSVVDNSMRYNFINGLTSNFSFLGMRKRDLTCIVRGLGFFFFYNLLILKKLAPKNDSYVGLDEFNHKFKQDNNYKNINFLFNLLVFRYSVGFKVSCVEVDKKYRKKLQTRYVMRLVYLSSLSKKKHFLKNFRSFVLNSKIRGLQWKVFNVFSNAMFALNSSEYFMYKNTTIKYLLQKKI